MTKIVSKSVSPLISALGTVDLVFHHTSAVRDDNGHHFDVVERRHLDISRVVGDVLRRRGPREQSAERPTKLLAHGAVDEEVDWVRDEREQVEIE